MASLFRARRRRSPEDDGEDGDRCGSGRAKRRCLSPEEGARTPDEAAEEEGRCRWWFSAFLGAAKRVSSVLCPDEQVSEEEEEEGSEAGTSSNVGNIGNDYGVEGGGAYYHGTSNPQMIQPTNQDVDNSGGTSAPKGRGSVAAKDREPRALDTFSIRRLKKMLREELANPRVPKRRRINLVKIKGQKKEQTSSTNGKPAAKKQSPGELRLHKDIAELNLPKTTEMSFPQGKEDLMNFEVSVRPNEGYYVGGKFAFTFQVPSAYPHEPPKVKCKTKVYHPNIDLEGNVGLNILREDWKPVLNISTIVYGLNLLFSQPNEEDPLNHEAAAVLRDDPPKFAENVERAMARGFVDENQSLGVCNA